MREKIKCANFKGVDDDEEWTASVQWSETWKRINGEEFSTASDFEMPSVVELFSLLSFLLLLLLLIVVVLIIIVIIIILLAPQHTQQHNISVSHPLKINKKNCVHKISPSRQQERWRNIKKSKETSYQQPQSSTLSLSSVILFYFTHSTGNSRSRSMSPSHSFFVFLFFATHWRCRRVRALIVILWVIYSREKIIIKKGKST